jgi:hypothetical protein
MSIVTKKATKTYNALVSVTCDKCHKIITSSNFVDWQEWQCISFTGGYGSLFGDGVTVRVDLCQDCLFDMIKDIYKIEENFDDIGDDV